MDEFTAFYREHARGLLRFFAARTRDAEVAADLTAETFAAALDGWQRVDPRRGEPVQWLYGIANRKLSRWARQGAVEDRARRRLRMERLELDDDALRRVEELAGLGDVRVELDALPPEQRDAVTRRVVLEHDYDEIACAAGTSPAAARQRVSRGLATLRARLSKEGP